MKLHRLSIPYRIVERLFSLLAVLIIVPFVVSSATDNGALLLVSTGGTFLVLVGVSIAWEIAYYRRYEYELTPDTFDIKSGVLSRREREIPYGRIQNVSINRNVFQRVLGLAEVRFETAGGQGSEAHLRFVSHDRARELQNELSDRKAQVDDRRYRRTGADDGESTDATSTATKLYEIDTKELGLLGIISFDFRFLTLLLILLPTFGAELGGIIEGSGVTLAVLGIAAVIIVLYLISAAISGIYAVTNYYGFTLYRGSDELRYERGLLQRYSGTIPLEKVQTLSITENLLARRFGYASLLVETAGFSPGEAGGSQSAVPIATRERVDRLATDIEPYGHVSFERPPKRARERYVFRYLGVVGILTAVAYAAVRFGDPEFAWYGVAGLAVLAPIAAHLKWKHRGYALLDDHVVTRNGFWTRKTVVVPYHRIQTVVDSQTIFQRRRRLATLTIDTAGASGLLGNDSKYCPRTP